MDIRNRLLMLSVVLIMFCTLIYSAFSTNLAITGEANIRAVSDIRITNVTLDKITNEAIEQYKGKYTKNTVTNGVKLPNINQFDQNLKFTPYLFKDEMFEGKFLLDDKCKVLKYEIRKI